MVGLGEVAGVGTTTAIVIPRSRGRIDRGWDGLIEQLRHHGLHLIEHLLLLVEKILFLVLNAVGHCSEWISEG